MAAAKDQMTTATAPELLKAYGVHSNHLVNLGGILRKLAEDKGFHLGAIRALAVKGLLGSVLKGYLLRVQEDRESTAILNYFGRSIHQADATGIRGYRGNHHDNAAIDRALSSNPSLRTTDSYFGEGIGTDFQTFADLRSRPSNGTPIAVIGYGAAGILITNALTGAGFRNITVYEKSRQPHGIWRMDNVFRQSRNNPRSLRFGRSVLRAAPGSGEEVSSFLDEAIRNTQQDPYYFLRHETVKKVEPGKLLHKVHLNGDVREYPIVINAIGLGKPSPLSDPLRMETESQNGGIRWQQNITKDPKKVDGKRLVFIGLGNSTAEMLRQVHTLIEDGYDIDYRVLTHYPKSAVFNPDDTVLHKGRNFRVFRDLSKPNLVDYQGDLADSRYDYFRALRTGKILHGVRKWTNEGKDFAAYDHEGKLIDTFKCDQLYTLTGYKHTQESLGAMGCTWDPKLKCALFDYDGEFIADPKASDPDQRLFKGYYGFGSVLETPLNPNGIVIPGMLFRIGDLVMGAIMRAEEFTRRNP